MVHARVVRQPNRGAIIGTVDEAAITRAAKGSVGFVRNGNFLAVVGKDETAVELAGAAAVNHVTWTNVEAPTPLQQEASWLLQRPAIDRVIGAPEPADAQGKQRFEATYTRGHLAHASISPSCGLAEFRDGHLTVWTHCQGVYPLKAALVRNLGLTPAAITVNHVQGSGCYGHNGADDAAGDAAIVALAMPGKPVRVRWRREEEFVYEPKSPAMVVKVRALLDDNGKPADWTQEIWSGTHNMRPGAGGNLLGAQALPNPNARTAACLRARSQWRRWHPQRRYRFTISPPNASFITLSSNRRCAPRRCAGSAPCPTCSRWNAASTNWPSAPGRTRWPTGCRSSRTLAPAPSSRKSPPWPTGRPTSPAAPDAAAASPSRATRTAPPIRPAWSSLISRRRSLCATFGGATDAGLVINS